MDRTSCDLKMSRVVLVGIVCRVLNITASASSLQLPEPQPFEGTWTKKDTSDNCFLFRKHGRLPDPDPYLEITGPLIVQNTVGFHLEFIRFCSHKFHKIVNYLIFEQVKKRFDSQRF